MRPSRAIVFGMSMTLAATACVSHPAGCRGALEPINPSVAGSAVSDPATALAPKSAKQSKLPKEPRP